jgi:hypothetical protein
MRIWTRNTTARPTLKGVTHRPDSAVETEEVAFNASVSEAPPYASPFAGIEALRLAEEARINKACRWHTDAMPLGLAIDPFPHPAFCGLHGTQLTQLITHVARCWEYASEGRVQIISAPLGEEAIRIGWSETPLAHRPYEVGHTDRILGGERTTYNLITHATITLITQPLIDAHLDETRRLNRFKTTILHEVGHALGLEHSRNKYDVMHHRGWRNPGLTENDLRSIQALYPPGDTDISWG